jgi:hypothetical protein
MYARRQIDEAMFLAARRYQEIYERARSLASVRSVDLEMPPIEGLRSDGLTAAAAALAATDELKRLETALERHLGESGLFLVRDVLGLGKKIERAAAERGDREASKVRWGGVVYFAGP